MLLSLGAQAQMVKKATVFEGTFNITTVAGEDISDKEFTLEIVTDKGVVKGSTGCNIYNTDYMSKDKSLRFSFIASTKKNCPYSEIEQSYYDSLISADRFDFEDDVLILYQDDVEIIRASKN